MVAFQSNSDYRCEMSDPLVVTTPLGKLRGLIYETVRGYKVYSFQGIPYAKPPINELRFKNPVAIEPWSGILSAEKTPPMAPTLAWGDDGSLIQQPNSSEDCLYLNLFAPQAPKPEANLPVMVFFHGGGFTGGSGNQDWVGPDYLVPKGVILINVNYRLGAFGFLSFKNLECPGNYGLKDQSLALSWIKNNISAFGGNPDNVTIFGQSAGGASVQYHFLSLASRKLFNRGIAQSGSALNRWAYSRYPIECATLLAKRLGCNQSDPNLCLKTITSASTLDILKQCNRLFQEIEGEWAGERILSYPFVPTAEPQSPTAFLTKTPKQALADGDFADLPYMTGVCTDEMIFCLPNEDYIPPWNDDSVFQKMLPKELNVPLDSDKMKQASQKLKEFYFPQGSTQQGWIQALSGLTFRYGVAKTVEAYATNPNKKTPNYLYTFTVSRDISSIKRLCNVENVPGVSHQDDIEYQFFTSRDEIGNPAVAVNSFDDRVMKTLTTLWTDFAKTGVASSDWPVADASQSYPYVEIGESVTKKTGFYADEVKFWDGIYEFLQSE